MLNNFSDQMHCNGVTRFRQMWVDKVPQTPLHHHWLPQIRIQYSANTNTVQHICKYKYVTTIGFDEDTLASPMPFHIAKILMICNDIGGNAKKYEKFKQMFAGGPGPNYSDKETNREYTRATQDLQ